MLESDFVLILNIVVWILGVVLAAKLSRRMRVLLNYLFIPIYILIIYAIWMAFIWVGGSLAGGYGGLHLFIIPEGLTYVLILIMLGYHWTRFLAVPFKPKKSLFLFIAMLPILLRLALYIAAVINAIQLKQIERTAMREGVENCIFNSTEFQLPDMPYIACTSDGFSFNTPQRYQTIDKKNQAFHRKRRKRHNYKFSHSIWLLDWQDKCNNNEIEDPNCRFNPPPISFEISKDVYKIRPARVWRDAYSFHISKLPREARKKAVATFYENSRIKSFKDLLSTSPLSSDRGIKTWAAPPRIIVSGKSKETLHFSKGIHCLKPNNRQGIEKEYQCTAAFSIFTDDLHPAFEPILNMNLENIKYQKPVGISFSYEADNKDEIAQGFIEGEATILTYMKADDLYDRCKSGGVYLKLGDHQLYYPVLRDVHIHQSVRKEAKDKCLNPIGIERAPADDLSGAITYFRKRLATELPPLTVSVDSIEPRPKIYTKPPKSECGETSKICSRITRRYRENKTRIHYKSKKDQRTLPPFTSKMLQERQFVIGSIPENHKHSWTPQRPSGPNMIGCHRVKATKRRPKESYNCSFSYMIETDISVYARFTTYVTPDNSVNFTTEIENVILRVEEDWTKLKTDSTKQAPIE